MSELQAPLKTEPTTQNIKVSAPDYATPLASHAAVKKLDILGAGLSLACAVHCAAQPLLLIVLPTIGLGFLMNEQVETLFLAATIILAGWTLSTGRKKHRQWTPVFPWLLGFVLIVGSRSFEHLEQVLAVSGALSIALAHFMNQWLLNKKQPHNHTH